MFSNHEMEPEYKFVLSSAEINKLKYGNTPGIFLSIKLFFFVSLLAKVLILN